MSSIYIYICDLNIWTICYQNFWHMCNKAGIIWKIFILILWKKKKEKTLFDGKFLLKFFELSIIKLGHIRPFFANQQTFFKMQGCVIDLVELKRWLYFSGIYFSAWLIQALDPAIQVIFSAGASAMQNKKKSLPSASRLWRRLLIFYLDSFSTQPLTSLNHSNS